MEKEIFFSKVEEENIGKSVFYLLTNAQGEEILRFSNESPKIQGKVIYEKIYKDYDLQDPVNIKLISKISNEDKEGSILFNQLQALFECIDSALNKIG